MNIYFYILRTFAFGSGIVFAILWYNERKKRIHDARKSEESEELFKTIFEQSGGYRLILEPTEDGIPVIVDANKAACDLHGYSRDELIGRPVTDLDDEEAQNLCKERTKKILSGEHFFVGNKHVRRDGSSFPVEVFADVVHFRNRSPLIVSTEFDVSEHKRAIEKLKKSEAYYKLLFESSMDAIIIADIATGKIQDANFKAETLLGKTRLELLQMNQFDLYPEPIKYQNIFRKYINSEFKSVEMYSGELLHKDGTVIPVEISSATVLLNGNSVAISSFHDLRKRIKQEDALKASEEKFRSVYDNAPLSYQSLNEDGCFLDVNPNWLRTLGYEREEVIGRKYVDFLHPDYQCYFDDNFLKLKTDGHVNGLQFKIRHKDGHYIYVELEGRAGYNSDGSFRHTYCVFQNITARKQAEDKLKKQQYYLEKAQELGNIGAWELDLIENKLYWTDENCRIFGMDPGSVVDYETFLSKVYPDDLEYVKSRWEAGVEGDNYDIVHRILIDGTLKWVREKAEVIFNADGLAVRAVGFTQDITEQKLAAAEKHRMLKVIEQTADAIIITDLEGIIEYVNPAFESITGYSREEVIGKKPNILKSGEHDNSFYTNLWGTLLRGETWVGKFTNKKKNGSIYIEYATISVVKDINGHFVNYVAVKRDITEQMKLEGQLSQAQKMDAIGRLAGGVAHDFNNMLGVILGHTEMALDQITSDQSCYEDLIEIKKAGERSAALTKQLLGFARKQTVIPKVIRLNQVISDMTNMLHRMIGEDIELTLQLSRDLWSIKMDPSQIDQVLVNLCVNARDAISDVGKITIETGNKVFDVDYCEQNAGFIPGEYVLMTVSDDGCGMSNEIRDNVFEPFFTTKKIGEGTGLGLPMVYGVVKQNNGFINIYSELGVGTTIKIYLPRYVDQSYSAPVEKQNSSVKSGNETILLVEDEPSILHMTQKMLEASGYTVLPAGLPDYAIEIADSYRGKIDMIMTDMVMPQMNGYDLSIEISERLPHIKCLYMSGYTADVIANHDISKDNINFIQKPFSIRELSSKIREVLS